MLVKANVANAAEVKGMVDEIVAQFGWLDILINNAGIYPVVNLIDMTEAEWDETIDINLKSVFLCSQTAARHMIKRGEGGNIINISSIEAVNPAAGHCHYTASKGGVLMFTMTRC